MSDDGYGLKIGVMLAVVIGVGGGVGYVATRPPKASASPAPSSSSTAANPERRRLEDALAKEPCDRKLALDLAKILVREEPRAMIDRDAVFYAKCGEYAVLRELDYTAHLRLSEWDNAIADVSKLIEDAPDHARYYGQRGLAREQKKDLPGAVADFRQALELDSSFSDIPLNLADDLEKLHQPCEAIEPLEMLVARHPDASNLASIRTRIDMLYLLDECKGLQTTGKATIRFKAGQTARAKVTLNGKVSLMMIVDTGATDVTITPKTATQLGIDPERLEKVRVSTAAGVKIVRHGRLEQVTIQGLSAKNVDMDIADDLGAAEGLLGQSFLSRFKMTTDNAAGKIELVGRK